MLLTIHLHLIIIFEAIISNSKGKVRNFTLVLRPLHNHNLVRLVLKLCTQLLDNNFLPILVLTFPKLSRYVIEMVIMQKIIFNIAAKYGTGLVILLPLTLIEIMLPLSHHNNLISILSIINPL